MRKYVCFFSLVVGLAYIPGCSNSLTRAQAEALIRKDKFWSSAEIISIQVVDRCFHTTVPSIFDQEPFMNLRDLAQRQLLTVTAEKFNVRGVPYELVTGKTTAGPHGHPLMPPVCQGIPSDAYHWAVSVTDAGVKAGIPRNGGDIATHRYEFEKVSRLTEDADGTTTAEFFWNSALTKEGIALGINYDFGEANGRATFKKDQEGWRLTQLSTINKS